MACDRYVVIIVSSRLKFIVSTFQFVRPLIHGQAPGQLYFILLYSILRLSHYASVSVGLWAGFDIVVENKKTAPARNPNSVLQPYPVTLRARYINSFFVSFFEHLFTKTVVD